MADRRAPGFEEAWHEARKIEGWLTKAQASALYDAAGSGGIVVEIGAAHGRSTIVLAHAARRVVAITPVVSEWGPDTHSYPILLANTARYGARVDARRSCSLDAAWHEPITTLFIDGAHDFRAVLSYIDNFTPRVTGTVLIHDVFSSTGVTRAVLRRFLVQRRWRYAGATGSLVMFRREPIGMLGAARCAVSLTCRTPWFARNLLIKVSRRQGWRWPQVVLGHRHLTNPY